MDFKIIYIKKTNEKAKQINDLSTKPPWHILFVFALPLPLLWLPVKDM